MSTPHPTNMLEHWLEQEQLVKQAMAKGPGVGTPNPDDISHLSGLEACQAMLRGELAYASMGPTLDFLLIEVAHGKAIFQGTPRAQFFNPMGTIHGGWYATLLDSALACAVHTTLPAGRAYTTTDLNLKLVRALTHHVPRVRVEATVVHAGRQLATAEARLIGPDGKLYAHGNTSCLIFDPKNM